LNYNLFILSAPFFLGALYLPTISDYTHFAFLFFLVYILLFGGANAYNSYIDKDEGPIGGLEHPPKMARWMYYGAWLIQILGFIVSISINFIFGVLYLVSILLSWMYSGTTVRLKAKPLLSFFVVGIGTAFNTTIMGYLASGGTTVSSELILGALGITIIILSMYPFSQAYQIKEDTKRGDRTFAAAYGIQAIQKNYLYLFIIGFLLLSSSFHSNNPVALSLFIIGVVAYISIWQVVKTITGDRSEYKKVMKTKYYGGMAFTLAILLLLLLF
jgi:4-hydroxybenzoate polyprenyltransferase